MKKRLTCNKLKELIKDEEKGYREYKSYGLSSLAKDEHRHKNILTKKLRRCKWKEKPKDLLDGL